MTSRAHAVPAHVRVMAKVEMVTESGCWIFMGSLNRDGYSEVGIGSRTDGTARIVGGHRVMYEALRGPIPAGLTLDHVKERCGSRSCVNPWHLQPVPFAVNVLRGDSPAAVHARRESCPKCGGAYEQAKGRRLCRPCWRTYQRDYQRGVRERRRVA